MFVSEEPHFACNRQMSANLTCPYFPYNFSLYTGIQEPLDSLVQREMVKLWLNHNCSPCDGDVRRAPSPIEQTHSIVSVS